MERSVSTPRGGNKKKHLDVYAREMYRFGARKGDIVKRVCDPKGLRIRFDKHIAICAFKRRIG